MKLEKLRLLRDELREELQLDGIVSTVYYFYAQKWNQLDEPSPVSTTNVSRLDRCKSEPIAFRARSSKTAWYACTEIECGISLTFATSPQTRTLTTYRRKISNVLKRATNSYKVSHNPLTQLLARDAFRETLTSAFSSLSNDSPPSNETQETVQDKIIAVMALDIDYFKQINDTHGHLYGDQVLRAFAIRLEQQAEEINKHHQTPLEIVTGHPSGEEFLISLVGCLSREDLRTYANQFRTKIGAEPLPNDSEWSRLSNQESLSMRTPPPLQERMVKSSIGIAIHAAPPANEDVQSQVTTILENADTALYRAKAAGRDQVIAFDDILDGCGRVLEHDLTNRIIAIDIGKNVGVSLGQEFRVFTPGYTGKKKFSVSDGRTIRTIGNYPRVELTTITVFDVQPELSFAYVSDVGDRSTHIEVGATLEAIPTGSISHLLAGASRYFPTSMHHIKIGDLSALQEFIKTNAATNSTPFAVVFRFASAQEYLKKYGSAAFNAALARLFREATSTFQVASAINILDSESIVMVGRGNSYDEIMIERFVENLGEEYPELRLVAGAFCSEDIEDPSKSDNSALDPAHAIEFARYAASDYAGTTNTRVTHFDFSTARRILLSILDSKAYTQGLADFEKLRGLGVENARLLNIGGLLLSKVGNHVQAAELYEAASKRDPDNLIYKTNLAIAAYRKDDIERGLRIHNSLSNEDVKKLKEVHPFGFVAYARSLAQAKLDGIAGFDPERFSCVAEDALNMEGYKDSERSKVIALALSRQ